MNETKCEKHTQQITEIRTEFTQFKKDVEDIKTTVKNAEENSVRLNKEFDKLMFHLIGDKDTGTSGLVQDFRAIKIRLSRVEKFYVVVAGVVGFIISAITLWVKKII